MPTFAPEKAHYALRASDKIEIQPRKHITKWTPSTLNLPKQSIMEIKNAFAGTLESGDILVRISPAESKGLQINLTSTVAYQFGEQIKAVISETLNELGVADAVIDATDKGALDCTIRARVTAAAVRATGKDVWK